MIAPPAPPAPHRPPSSGQNDASHSRRMDSGWPMRAGSADGLSGSHTIPHLVNT